VSRVENDSVVKLRTAFLKRAVTQIRELAARGETEEAFVEGSELRHYFEWFKERISPEERHLLFEQIQALPISKPVKIDDESRIHLIEDVDLKP